MAPRGRPPSAKTLVDRHLGRTKQILPAGEMLLVPNHSGDHSAGNVQKSPTGDKDIVNKQYVDGYAARREMYNGSIRETFNALVTSNGSTVTVTLTNAVSGDLTLQFSDGDTNFTTGQTINLTPGTDTSPTTNYIYIPLSTKVLTLSTSDFPSTEHIKIGFFLVPSAAFVQTNGCYINQNWNDHLTGTNDMGHWAHIGEKIRHFPATYFDGVTGNGTDGYLTPTASNVELKSTSGRIYQMHIHTFPSFDTSGGDEVLVKNWNGDSYHNISNLFDITADSTGVTIGANKYFNLTIWGVGNKSGEYEPMMVNLPSGFYNTQSGAENDVSGFDDFDMPREFNLDSSTGFLIARITIKMGTTWDVISTVDLRGDMPSTATGGIGSSSFWEVDGTETQLINADAIDMQSNKIINVTDPTADQEAATKKYVDDNDANTTYSAGVGLDLTSTTFSTKGTKFVSITIENPTSAEDISICRFNEAVTITKVVGVIIGATSVTINPKHFTLRSSGGNALFSSAQVVSSTGAGDVDTSFADATIPADSFLWLETTALSGTPTELNLTFFYTTD